jgi:hypothetical protein
VPLSQSDKRPTTRSIRPPVKRLGSSKLPWPAALSLGVGRRCAPNNKGSSRYGEAQSLEACTTRRARQSQSSLARSARVPLNPAVLGAILGRQSDGDYKQSYPLLR